MEKEQASNIPDIDIIDLDDNDTFFDESSLTGENDDIPESDTETDINDEDSNGNAPQKKGFRLNIHVILLASVLIVLSFSVLKTGANSSARRKSGTIWREPSKMSWI